jgi:hypothetical protein
LVVIDACATLNLLATGREVDIVEALGIALLETDRVSREVFFLWTAPDEDGVRRKEPASKESLIERGLLEARMLDTDPLIDAFVTCAARIKDTDASCIALAGVLWSPLVTDDAKERKIALDVFPQIELLSTLDLVHDAAARLKWDDAQLTDVALALRWRGNFAPPKRDPRGPWFVNLLARAGVSCP